MGDDCRGRDNDELATSDRVCTAVRANLLTYSSACAGGLGGAQTPVWPLSQLRAQTLHRLDAGVSTA